MYYTRNMFIFLLFFHGTGLINNINKIYVSGIDELLGITVEGTSLYILLILLGIIFDILEYVKNYLYLISKSRNKNENENR